MNRFGVELESPTWSSNSSAPVEKPFMCPQSTRMASSRGNTSACSRPIPALRIGAERRAREQVEREKRAVELARWQETLEGRISLALSHTGAELVNWRRNGQRQAVVRYRVAGRRFECVIDTESLQIMDAGICLSGTDEELNLSSLPSAVREAIESGQLHVFRNV